MVTHNPRVCPKCGCDNSYVIDSRSFDEYIYRRRECAQCGNKFAAYEILGDDYRSIKRALQSISR